MTKYQALKEALEAGPVAYACHCDLEPHMQPDGCAIDEGKPENCVYAGRLVQRGLSKTDCHEWKPISVVKPTIEVKAATIRKLLADLDAAEKALTVSREALELYACGGSEYRKHATGAISAIDAALSQIKGE